MDSFVVQFPKLNLDFNIRREALTIGTFSIYWYAVLIALGAVLGILYIMKNAKTVGLNSDKIVDVILAGLISGIVGARAYYVIFNLDNYDTLWEMINLRDGGLGIYGGIILGLIAIIITCHFNKTKLMPMLDISIIGVLIGQAIGRWGNFVNQEAFGTNTNLPWGMYSEKTAEYLSSVQWDLFKQGIEVDPSLPVHPCFLYESIWCALGVLLGALYLKRRKFDGEVCLIFAGWYGLGRAFIESLRTDSLMIGPFRVSQLVGIIVAISCVTAIILIRINLKKKNGGSYGVLYKDTEESKSQLSLDDLSLLNKARNHLFEANDTLASAKEDLDIISKKIMPEVNAENADELFELSRSVEAEEKLSKPDETLNLAEKKIALALSKITLASTTLDDYYLEGDEDLDDSADEEESEEKTFENEFDRRVYEFYEQIAALSEYTAECLDKIACLEAKLYPTESDAENGIVNLEDEMLNEEQDTE